MVSKPSGQAGPRVGAPSALKARALLSAVGQGAGWAAEWAWRLLEEWLPMATLVVSVAAVLVQVFWRYVLDRPLTWPFEVSIYGYVWTLYLGAAYAARRREHIRLDVVYAALPDRVRRVCDIVFNLVTSAVFIWALKPVWEYLLFSYRIRTVGLKLPWTYVLAVFPAFLVLVTLHSLARVIEDVQALARRRDGSSGGSLRMTGR